MSAVTALSKNKYTIKANSTQTISFLGANPNHYFIINGGNTALYVGISMMPTENFYDAKIPSASSKLCVDAYGHKEIYIYNPSVEDANIIITSFEAPFEAETLAMSGLGQDMTSIELAGEFDAKGDLKTQINKIADLMKSIEEKSGNTDNESYKEDLTNIVNTLGIIDVEFDLTITDILKSIFNDLMNVQRILGCENYNIYDYTSIHGYLDLIVDEANSPIITRLNDIAVESLHIATLLSPDTNGFIQTVQVRGYETETVTAPEGKFFSKINLIKNKNMKKGVVIFKDLNNVETEINIEDIADMNLNLTGKYASITFCEDEGNLSDVVLIAEVTSLHYIC